LVSRPTASVQVNQCSHRATRHHLLVRPDTPLDTGRACPPI